MSADGAAAARSGAGKGDSAAPASGGGGGGKRPPWKHPAAILGGGAALFLGFLLVAVGAGNVVGTYALVVCGAALILLLSSMYQMALALSRPSSEVVIDHEAALDHASTRALREEKRRVLRALNELQFDHELGKLSAEDYKAVRERYELRAVEVMRALDDQGTLHPELQAALGRLEDVAQDPGACLACGAANKESAKFCSECGANLVAEATA